MLDHILFFFAKRYTAGKYLRQAIALTKTFEQRGLLTTLDHLGEDVHRASEAIRSRNTYLRILEHIHTSHLSSQIAIKLTSLGLTIDRKLCVQHVTDILSKANVYDITVTIDMEGSAHTADTITIYKELRSRFDNVGVAIQSYLIRSKEDVAELLPLKPIIRLVKGAYKEPESIAYAKKRDVDRSFLELARHILDSDSMLHIATHDRKIISSLCRYIKHNNISSKTYEFQFLLGIQRALWKKLLQKGHTVRIYVPYGTHFFPYTFRRLMERRANMWFALKSLFR